MPFEVAPMTTLQFILTRFFVLSIDSLRTSSRMFCTGMISRVHMTIHHFTRNEYEGIATRDIRVHAHTRKWFEWATDIRIGECSKRCRPLRSGSQEMQARQPLQIQLSWTGVQSPMCVHHFTSVPELTSHASGTSSDNTDIHVSRAQHHSLFGGQVMTLP